MTAKNFLITFNLDGESYQCFITAEGITKITKTQFYRIIYKNKNDILKTIASDNICIIQHISKTNNQMILNISKC